MKLIKYGSEVGEDEIQSELGKIASEAVKEHQLRWRILDYLAFWEIDLNGSGKTRVDRVMSSTHPDGDERLHPFGKSKTDQMCSGRFSVKSPLVMRLWIFTDRSAMRSGS